MVTYVQSCAGWDSVKEGDMTVSYPVIKGLSIFVALLLAYIMGYIERGRQ